ncbi:hypothetical protein LLG88_13505 [bacterium]|nr:hypothetical protein [bacterium]
MSHLPLFEERLEREFLAFHEANPHVYRKLAELAVAAKATGRGHFGIGALFERLRWWSRFETDGTDPFKLNNNYRAFYARLLMRDYPELAGFFETRSSVADGEAA